MAMILLFLVPRVERLTACVLQPLACSSRWLLPEALNCPTELEYSCSCQTRKVEFAYQVNQL